MSELKLGTPLNQTVSISSDAISRILAEKSGNAALVYLCLLKDNGTVSYEKIKTLFGWDEGQLSAAVNALRNAGLLDGSPNFSIPPVSAPLPTVPPEREVPEYTANEIVRAVEGNEDFRMLITEAQRRLGKILSSADLTVLFGLYDYIGLPVEVLYLLINHCIEESHRRYGSGRKPTLRQIEKEGYIWARYGIDTEERAAAHIKQLDLRRSDVYKIMGVLQISSRAPSRPEEKYIVTWLEMGFGTDAIELAYDKTVLKCKELNWNYMNSILKSWHEKNLHLLSEITQCNRSPSAKRPSGEPARDISRRKDIDEMKSYLKMLKEQG